MLLLTDEDCFRELYFVENNLVKRSKLVACPVWGEGAWPLVINWGQMEDPLLGFMLVIKHNLFDFFRCKSVTFCLPLNGYK